MDECPVCLEPLTGTVVHLGCCNKQVHIQCYVTKCPLCRADLPAPHGAPPQHVIIPVPQPTRMRSIGAAFLITLIVCAALFSPLPPRHSSP